MSRKAWLRLFAPPALALIATAAAASTLVYGNVSGWTVRTVPADAYRCYAEAEYEGGTHIRIGFDTPAASLYIIAGDPSWSDVVAGSEYTVEVQFDEEPTQQFTAMALADAGLKFLVSQQQQEAFLENFMSGFAMSIGPAGRESIVLGLGGSHNATRMLENCQATMAKS